MKKLLIGLIVIVVLVFCSVYFFIPRKLIIIEEIKPACSINCVQRMMGISNYRKKWLPEDTKIISPAAFILDGCTFSFAPDAFYNNNVKIKYKKINVNSMLFAEAAGNATVVNWEFNLQSSNNPFARLSDYLDAKHIKITMNKMLQNLLVFLNSRQNIYGFDIQKITLPDSTLIALKAVTNHYPTVSDIYTNIERLRQYANANGVSATNAPMLNIKNNGDILPIFSKIYKTLQLGYSIDNLLFANMCLSQFLTLFIYNARHYESVSSDKADCVDSAILYMQEHINESISLNNLSSQFHYSVSRFSNLFKQKTGYAPIDYFVQMKMQKACQQLDFTGSSVKEIAFSMGFDDPYYFSKRFRTIIGMSPKKYRAMNNG